MTVRLEWGAANLYQVAATAARPYTMVASSDGTDFGNPQAVITAIRSRLQNGALAEISSYDNREAVVSVLVESVSFDGLAAAEAALFAEESVEGFNRLVWSPSVELARPVVFDVVYGKLLSVFDDFAETQLRRVYRIEFNTLPFPHEETLTTVTATSAAPTTPVTTGINDGSAATGWTATKGSTPTASGGLVSTTAAGTLAAAPSSLTKAATFPKYYSVDLGGGASRFKHFYVYVDWKAGARTTGLTTATSGSSLSGGNLPPIAAPSGGGSPAAGFTRSWYRNFSAGGDNPATDVQTSIKFTLSDLLASESFQVDQFGTMSDDMVENTVYDNGSSATNWTATNGSAPASTSGYVYTLASGVVNPGPVYLNLAASIDGTATPYVFVDWKLPTSGDSAASENPVLTFTTADGTVTATRTSSVTSGGLTRTYFQLTPITATAFQFGFSSGIASGRVLSVDQVTKTNVPPTIGTTRQQARSLAIGGSADTQATMILRAPAGQTLGKSVLVYNRTRPTGFQPPLRQYLVSSSTVTTDTATVSGARHLLTAPAVYRLPAARVLAAGHAVLALVRVAAAGTYTLSATAKLTSAAGADIPESVVTATTGVTTLTLATDTLFGFVELGILQLPTVVVASDSDATLTITIPASAGVEVDDLYLLDQDNGVMSLLDTVGLTRVELRTPNLTAPEETVWGGYADGGGSLGLIRQDYRLKALGQHVLSPGPNEVFTVSPAALGSVLSAAYYRSVHSNLGGV